VGSQGSGREKCEVKEKKYPVKITLKLDPDDWQTLEGLRGTLCEPTTIATVKNLIRLVNSIVSYQKQGYRLQLTQNGGETVVIFMVTQPSPTPSG